MIAMALKQPQNNKAETNNWLRWAIGIIVTIILGLTVHLGNEGSRIKDELSTEKEARRQMEKKIDRIEDKLDRLIERK
jgi:uncharacterized membrane-anchored protein YhcB (DUF1043 family)